MITKKIISPKLPSITIHYCSGISEGYKDVLLKHNVNMVNELIEERDTIHGFTITDDLDDKIDIYLDEDISPELYAKVAIHEAINAGLAIIRRKLFYTFNDRKPITLGNDPDVDELIFDTLSKVCTKVLLKRFEL